MPVHSVGYTLIFFLVFGGQRLVECAAPLWEGGCEASGGGGLGVGRGVEGLST